MSVRQRARRSRATSAPRRAPVVAVGIAVVAVVIAFGAWVLFRPSPAGEGNSGTAGMPGPIGGSNVAMDVNTLVGKPAPAFTLSDSDGTSYAVTPGQGKPIVLISHMGIT